MMTQQQILDQSNTLGLVALTVMKEYDSLKRQVRDGLLLAVAGRVQQISQDAYRVNSHNVFIIGTPARWHCNCEQGTNYGPVHGDFLGYPGRICKHVAAVALIQTSSVDTPPLLPRPASILELVTRLAVVPLAALFCDYNEVELPVKLPSPVRLVVDGDKMVLSAGRVTSDVLYNVCEGRLRIDTAMADNYHKFFKEMQERGLAPVTPPVETVDAQLGLQEATL